MTETSEIVLGVRGGVVSCTRCDLFRRCRRPVPWDGPVPSRVAIVGEAPGKTEDEEGVPFVGLSGGLARSWVEPRFGKVAWVNAVSCYPNRTPTGTEVDACRTNLMAQLRVIEPELLLLFGGIAVSAWVSGYRVGELRGRWVKCPIEGDGRIGTDVWGLVTWHPAAVLRNRSLELDVLDDLQVFRDSFDGLPPYVYQPCVKCGSMDGTQVTKEGIAWCRKHWEWKNMGRGRRKQGPPAKRAKKPTLF